jgi:GntR family transcriptional regulator, N-acetylglucosamine utilization regulator
MIASTRPFSPGAIRRDTPIPLHYQLSELLTSEIEAGHWKVGDRIPTEEDFCETFALSRTTVRRALEGLVIQGRLVREKGRGTFVAEAKFLEGLINRPVGFYEDMAARGITVHTPICEMEVIRPSEPVAHELELGPDEPVIKIDRLRYIDDNPILIVTTYLPQAKCPGLLQENLTNAGLYMLLEEKYGIKMFRAKRFVEAVAANEYEAEKLQVKRGAPLLLIESTSYLEDGRPIEYYKARHRGDRTRLMVETFSYDRNGVV